MSRGSEDEQRFLGEELGTRFVADDAERQRVVTGGSPLNELSFYDPTWMKVGYPDRIAPLEDAFGFIDYSERGKSDGLDHARVAFRKGESAVVVLGFPFEALARERHRVALMNRVLLQLNLATGE